VREFRKVEKVVALHEEGTSLVEKREEREKVVEGKKLAWRRGPCCDLGRPAPWVLRNLRSSQVKGWGFGYASFAWAWLVLRVCELRMD
jgi:hypothetical protein